MAKTDKKIHIGIMMTDKEFQEYHSNKRKEELLGEMFSAVNQPFSIKNVTRTKKKDNDISLPSFTPSEHTKKRSLLIEDEDWDAIIEKASEFNPSPIEEITKSQMGEFSLEDIGIKEETSTYQTMFKKEQAMLAEILKDVTKQAKAASTKLDDMTKKSAGYGGVSKTYPDLVSAANSLNTTRLNIIKEMAALKKTTAELEMKRAKEMGDTETTSNDDIADSFYKQIVSNRKQFVEESMNKYGGDYNTQPQSIPYTESTNTSYLPDNINDNMEDNQPPRVSRSITSSLKYMNDDNGTYNNDADPYGYIRNERSDVQICVERYPDGRVNFVAIDSDGEGVDDYELPGEDLLMDLEIRPMSSWANDSMGRRYRIIDIDSNGVDISDILEDD